MTSPTPSAGPSWTIQPAPSLTQDALAAVICSARSEVGEMSSATVDSRLHVYQMLLEEAEWLNGLNGNLPAWLRRILRKQGRINRLMIEAMEGALSNVDLPNHEGLDSKVGPAGDGFRSARHHNHAVRGSPIWKRIRRRQKDVNSSYCDGLEALSSRVFQEEPSDSSDKEAREHIKWHINEARFYNGRPRRGTSWRRRALRNQFEINRCELIAAKLLLPYVVR